MTFIIGLLSESRKCFYDFRAVLPVRSHLLTQDEVAFYFTNVSTQFFQQIHILVKSANTKYQLFHQNWYLQYQTGNKTDFTSRFLYLNTQNKLLIICTCCIKLACTYSLCRESLSIHLCRHKEIIRSLSRQRLHIQFY